MSGHGLRLIADHDDHVFDTQRFEVVQGVVDERDIVGLDQGLGRVARALAQAASAPGAKNDGCLIIHCNFLI